MKNNIYFRALEVDDYKTSIYWRQNDKIWEKLGGQHYFVSESYERKWVEEKILQPKSNEIILAICLEENGQYIGNVYLTDIDWINKNAQLHILIGEESVWGKGIGTEVINKIVDYGFKQRNLHRIYSHILASNDASIRVHEKCGFSSEGILRDAVYKNGSYQGLIIVSKLNKS